MAIEIICDDCGNKYRVGNDKAGSRVRCQECGSRIDVPGDDAEGESHVLLRSSFSHRKSRKDDMPLSLIIGAAGLVVVLLIGGLLFLSMGRKQVDIVAGGNPTDRLPNSGVAPPPPPSVVISSSASPESTARSNSSNPSKNGPPPSVLPGKRLPGTQVAQNTLPQTQPTDQSPKSTNSITKPNAGSFSNPTAVTDGTGIENPSGSRDPALDLPPPDNWNVKLDPAIMEFKFEEDKTVSLKIPKGGEVTDMVFPATPSPIVAIGNNRDAKNVREIWNIATKQKIGAVTGYAFDFHSKYTAISPDGKYFAAEQGVFKKNRIVVFQVKGSKPLGELEPGGEHSGVSAILFTSPDRLLALDSSGTAKTWKLPGGEPEHELQLGEAKEPYQIAVSPGGKYLAAVTGKNVLQIFDLEAANVVGELNLPSGHDFWKFTIDAMSFSPDGVELALTGEVFTKGLFLLRYNVADGKLLAKAPIDSNNHRTSQFDSQQKLNRLEWFLDRSKLLWKGHFVLDAQIGGPVWTAPEEPGSSEAPRKVLNGKQILVGFGGRNNPGLKTATIPLKEIEAATKVVAAGGQASDAGMPTLMKPNYEGMNLIAPVAANWSMQPDPAPAGNPAKSAIPLPKENPSISGIFISRPSVNKALVCYHADASQVTQVKGFPRLNANVPPHLQGTSLVEAYDLTKGGKAIAALPLPYKSFVLHGSLDGEHVVVKTTHPKDDRVDVYNVVTGKHIAGWRPFSQYDDQHKSVTSALLLDGEYCLTQNVAPFQPGSAYLWKLPECQAVWQMKNASNFVVSPGGKYLGFLADSRYLFMEARTGELVGELPVTMPQMTCAFHPMGTHLAILASDATHPSHSFLPSDAVSRKIAIVDVTTGKTTAEAYLPQGNDTIQWCGDTHVLIDNTWLVDLQQMKNGWRYLLESGCHARSQPDGRHWYVANGGGLDQSMTLSAATIPEKAVADKIRATRLPDEALLQPGMQLSLSVNLANAMPPDRPNLAQEVGTAFEAGLKKHGYSMVGGSPYTFSITTTLNSTGKNMEFIRGGSVPIQEVKCDFALISNGQTVWKHTRNVSNSAFMVFVQQGEDIRAHLAKNMWNGVADVLTKFPVPAQVFGGAAGAGLGQSKFTIGGVQPLIGR